MVFETKRKSVTVADIRKLSDTTANFVVRHQIDLREQGRSVLADIPTEKDRSENMPDGSGMTSSSISSLDELMSRILDGDLSIDAKEELTAVLNRSENPIADLASIGARMGNAATVARPRYRPILSKSVTREEEFHRKIIEKIREPIRSKSVSSANIKKSDISLASVVNERLEEKLAERLNLASTQKYIKHEVKLLPEENLSPAVPRLEKRLLDFSLPKKKGFFGPWFIWFLVFLAVGSFAYVFTLKNELIKDGISAVDNLQQAQESLKRFNFGEAAINFSESYKEFSKAGQSLSLIGGGLAGMFSDVPGLDKITGGSMSKLKSAKNIVEAGKLLAETGQAMSGAAGIFAKTGAILNPSSGQGIKPLRIVGQIRDALAFSSRNLERVRHLLAEIDTAIIPEDRRPDFDVFLNKLPLFESLLADSIGYFDFLEGIIGIDDSRKYLLLFQNSSELRPTGGFPGTYGVISFSNGGLTDFFVDDVYNLDGQIKENIIPPKQLQHITPTWGMRDSMWFSDFPSSARKAISFFTKEAGYGVDGVVVLNPDVVSSILEIIGPIKLPEYGVTLTAENFLTTVQEEVEYGENRIQPKKIVVDLAPRLLHGLYSAKPEDWVKIFNALMTHLEEKDILFYFNDRELEKFAVDKGFGGDIKQASADYLMVAFSNIKGSKTDAVTDSSISISSSFAEDKVIHDVAIRRKHNGGSLEQGFYNRQNSAYVRVLLPENSQLLRVTGNDMPNFHPLVDYRQGGFTKDGELTDFESRFYSDDSLGVDRYEESGKSGVGFWMFVEPDMTKEVRLEYAVPLSSDNYSFYFQKQPGLDWKNFKFRFFSDNNQERMPISPALNKIGDLYILDVELKKDIEIKFTP